MNFSPGEQPALTNEGLGTQDLSDTAHILNWQGTTRVLNDVRVCASDPGQAPP